jgi:hypothetical protein
MGISPVQITDNATVEHQGIADKFYSLFKGAEAYVEQWLPEHGAKNSTLTNISAAWDSAVTAIKGHLAETEAAAKTVGAEAVTQAEGDVKELATDVEPIAESAATTVAQTAETTVQDAAAEIPTPPTTPTA